MTGNEVRAKFLEFFQSHDHKIFKSSPLIPAKDPTLLFANAGMVPFKNVFLGQEDVGTRRATSSQKCLRVSGKHNDFENVGRTARHHTFFEMLGNFSFGDYFKQEAIRYGYEFLVDWVKLDPSRLWITVFEDDDEAEALWISEVGMPKERILRMGEKDNFWAMGDTGPCGPCTEIHYDQGESFGTGPQDVVGGEGDRFLEIWNLVFMQFNRDDAGVMTPLPSPCVDTGMGLERITAVLQGKATNFDSDLFMPIHRHTEQVAGKIYGDDPEATVSMRVIADHVRAATFLIGDAVLPSNEGRGYVLRRIMRRAARHGVLIGQKEPFLYKLAGTVIDVMRSAYPELVERRDYVAKVLCNEEERFLRTLENGLRILNEQIDKMKKADEGVLDGELAFRLYDTFGFPLDLTEDIGLDVGFVVDKDSFERAMVRQRATSAKAWQGSGETGMSEALAEVAQQGVRTRFMGYDELKTRSRVVGLVVDEHQVQNAGEGQRVQIVTAESPFYAEMGGQVGDAGKIENPDALVVVESTFSPAGQMIVHEGKLAKGRLAVGDEVELAVDPVRRAQIQANHSATHLLHHALRETLGADVKQAGSLVAPDRLRFDFTCFGAIEPSELRHIERRTNELIRANTAVFERVMPYENATDEGVIALFGEKYPDDVRVVSMGNSRELCGGTHVARTGDIGVFVIVSESSIAAGVRRIEALTGSGAVAYMQHQNENLAAAAELLKTSPDQLAAKAESLLADHKALEKKVADLTQKLSVDRSRNVLDDVREIQGTRVLAARVDVPDGKALRTLGADLRDRIGSGILALGAESNGNAFLVVMVTDDLTDRFHAGKLIGPLAQAVDGRGGGKPDMAQAGGKNPTNLDQALKKLYDLVAG